MLLTVAVIREKLPPFGCEASYLEERRPGAFVLGCHARTLVVRRARHNVRSEWKAYRRECREEKERKEGGRRCQVVQLDQEGFDWRGNRSRRGPSFEAQHLCVTHRMKSTFHEDLNHHG